MLSFYIITRQGTGRINHFIHHFIYQALSIQASIRNNSYFIKYNFTDSEMFVICTLQNCCGYRYTIQNIIVVISYTIQNIIVCLLHDIKHDCCYCMYNNSHAHPIKNKVLSYTHNIYMSSIIQHSFTVFSPISFLLVNPVRNLARIFSNKLCHIRSVIE